MSVADPPENTLLMARSVCVRLQQGHSRFEVNDELRGLNPDNSWGQLSDLVDLAVKFYCPEHLPLG